MKIENQVCTFEQAKQLKELKISQDSVFYYHQRLEEWQVEHEGEYNRWAFQQKQNMLKQDEHYSAFTCAELGVMCPESMMTYYTDHHGSWMWKMVEPDDDELNTFGWKVSHSDGGEYETEAEARAACLLYCLDKKLIKWKEVNGKLLD